MTPADRPACADHPNPELWHSPHPDHQAEAIALCNTCPRRTPCLAHALEHDEHGIWGGLTEHERAALQGKPRWTPTRNGDPLPPAEHDHRTAILTDLARRGLTLEQAALQLGIPARTIYTWARRSNNKHVLARFKTHRQAQTDERARQLRTIADTGGGIQEACARLPSRPENLYAWCHANNHLHLYDRLAANDGRRPRRRDTG